MDESGRRLCLRLLFLILLYPRVASQTPFADEKQILLQIKKDWGDPVLDSWKDTVRAPPNSTSYCSWPGVGCAADGSVVNVSLKGYSANKIGQPIPHSLCSLRRLTFLDLGYNSIPGPFPASLYDCAALRYLDLQRNRFAGVIPDDVYRLSPLLTHLDLHGNSFTGDIPTSIGRLPALQTLLLFNNLFDGTFPVEISNLSNLRVLHLAFNPFTPMRIPAEFGNLTKLSYMSMTRTNVIGDIPGSLSNLKAMVQLDLAENSLTGKIPAGIWALPSLKYLYIYKNKLSGSIGIEGMVVARRLVEIDVSMNQLSGSIPEDFGKLQNLSILFMSINQFSGDIPAGIGLLPLLSDLRLFENGLTGVLPPELGKHSPLQILDLGGNKITGTIPADLSLLDFLTDLNLSNNRLKGNIPASIGSLWILESLDLSSNELFGSIPAAMENLKLSFLNLSSNKLSGTIPAWLQSPAYKNSFLSNPGLCAGPNSHLNVAACRSGSGNSDGLARGLRILFCFLGAVVFLMTVAFAACVCRNHRRRKRGDGEDLADWKLTSFQSLDFTKSSIVRGMTEENVIGSGGAGTVYKVTLGDQAGEVVAVKKISSSGEINNHLEKGFQAEVEILGPMEHINIVKLLCCISGTDAKLLVYEYMENGSLDRWLHGKQWPAAAAEAAAAVGEPGSRLDWARRLEIAIGAARGLCYLHHQCSPAVIHGDIKSSNILLDSEFNARIGDFGVARLLVQQGESESASDIAGTFGYMAPECLNSSRLTEKVDVYSFGVVLLELTTGREALMNDPEVEQRCNLAEWARRREGTALLGEAVDPALRDSAHTNDIVTVLELGIRCTDPVPSRRPSMNEVLDILQLSKHPDPT